MLHQVILSDKCLVTHAAIVKGRSMGQGVLPQTAQLSEPLLTEATVEWFLLGVTSVVGGQFALIPQHFATATALQPEDRD